MWLLSLLWAVFFGYWGYAATRVRQAQKAEAGGSRLVHEGLFALAFLLTLTSWLRLGPLGWRWLPPGAYAAGVAVAAAGMGFAAWARYHLGQYWSGRVTIKAGHRLIRSGPYALARHPIYTGILVGMVGTAVAVGEVRGIVAALLVLLAYARKIPLEERWLLDQFGPEYERYRREVRALIPGLW